MNCEFKKTDIRDIDTLVELRLEFIKDIHPEHDDIHIENIRNGFVEYLKEHIQNNTYLGFLGIAGGEIVCSAGLLIYDLPPLYSEKPRKTGHVLNCFTKPSYRRRGYGHGLIEFIKVCARDEGISRLYLNATPSGYSLYEKAGFAEPEDKSMFIDL
jgi:GNAT superfamily N-acetyltransferase